MSAIPVQYGTIFYHGLEPSAGDKRSYGNPGGYTYNTITNASFKDGRSHSFSTANETMFITGYLMNVVHTDSTSYLGMQIDDEIRWYVEDQSTRTGTNTSALTFYVTGPSGGVQMDLRFSGGVVQQRIAVSDVDNGTTNGTWVTTGGTYHEMEGGFRFWRDGTTYKLTATWYMDGTLQDTVTVSLSTVTEFKVRAVGFGHSADATKAVVVSVQRGRIHISLNGGQIRRNDQQFFRTWAPTIVHAYPTGDVTSPDEWTGDGDATNLFENVNDNPYVYTTGNSVAATTSKKEALFSFANVGALTNPQCVVIGYQAQDSGPGAVNAVHQVICKNGSGTYKRGDAVTLVGNDHTTGAGYVEVHSFLTDPDANQWTETTIDDNDFGLDKPATAGSTAGQMGALWRYVLHAGNAITAQTSLLPQKRSSQKAMLVR